MEMYFSSTAIYFLSNLSFLSPHPFLPVNHITQSDKSNKVNTVAELKLIFLNSIFKVSGNQLCRNRSLTKKFKLY
jgi:hypothetical protein